MATDNHWVRQAVYYRNEFAQSAGQLVGMVTGLVADRQVEGRVSRGPLLSVRAGACGHTPPVLGRGDGGQLARDRLRPRGAPGLLGALPVATPRDREGG
jgi:hypothetical protein